MEYLGVFLKESQFKERMCNEYASDAHHYSVRVIDDIYIDSQRKGNNSKLDDKSYFIYNKSGKIRCATFFVIRTLFGCLSYPLFVAILMKHVKKRQNAGEN